MDHNKISHKGRGAVTIITGHFFLGDLRLGQVVDLPLGQVTVSLYKAALTCEITKFVSGLFQTRLFYFSFISAPLTCETISSK